MGLSPVTTMRGTVKFFNSVKGRAQLLDGEVVEYEIGEDRQGRPCAVKVRRSDSPEAPGCQAGAADGPGERIP